MKCPKCNYENKPDAVACGMCGEILKPKTEETPVAPAPAPAMPGRPAKACPNHPEKSVDYICSSCDKALCSECITETNGKKICLDCLSKSLNTGSQSYSDDSMDLLKSLWRVLGIILAINYVIPLMSMMGVTIMPWSAFQMSFMAGFALLLPTICGILLIILTIAGGTSKIRGLIVAISGLLALGFFYLGSSNPFGSGMESSSNKFSDFLTFVTFLSFALMLTGSLLKREREESKTASLLGGISGVIFLIATLIMIIKIISSPGFSLAAQIPTPTGGYGFLMTVTWIILIGCSIGCIISGVLAVLSLFDMQSKATNAHYSFKVGFLSTVISVGWILILIVIMALSMPSMTGFPVWWMVLFMYRTIFVFGALLLMLATGTYDWLKRANLLN